jgi:hypothetical protein
MIQNEKQGGQLCAHAVKMKTGNAERVDAVVPASLILLALHGVVAGAALQLALSVPGTVRPRNVHVVPQSRVPACESQRK